MAGSITSDLQQSSINEGVSPSVDNEYSVESTVVAKLGELLSGDSCSSYTWLTDVIPDQSFEDAIDLAKRASSELSGRKVVLIGYHPTAITCTEHESCDFGRRLPGDAVHSDSPCSFEAQGHIHIYHTCPYTSSTCRCGFMRGRRVERRRRPTRKCSEISREYISSILCYLQQDERFIISIQGRSTRYFYNANSRNENLRQCVEVLKSSTDGPLEGSIVSSNVCTEFEGHEFNSSAEQQSSQSKKRRDSETDMSIGPNGGTTKKIRRKRRVPYLETTVSNNEGNEIESMLSSVLDPRYKQKIQVSEILTKKILQLNCVPLSNCTNTKEWKKHRYLKTFNHSSQEFNHALRAANAIFLDKSIEDYVDYYVMQKNWPLFQATDKASDLYYDYDKSMNIMEYILIKQFGDIKKILLKFYKIFNKHTAKKNTVFLHGDPGSGKNYVMDPFCHFFLSVGTLQTLNKTNLFALQDLCDKRIGVFNDISIASNEFEYLKNPLGGNQCTGRKKFSDDVTINRLPFCGTSNNPALFPMEEEAWKQRILELKTKHIPELKKLTKLLYPLAVIGLWEKYEILETKTTFIFENDF